MKVAATNTYSPEDDSTSQIFVGKLGCKRIEYRIASVWRNRYSAETGLPGLLFRRASGESWRCPVGEDVG